MKKVTLATLKSFIRNNFDNLLIEVVSQFDGMQDCVISNNAKDFEPIIVTNHCPSYTLGIKGLWLVGQSNDYIKMYENDNYKWFNVYNCCGECNIAIKK